MRILITADPELPVPPPLYGGIERVVDLLARGLEARGHQVGLVAHRESTTPVTRHAWPGLRSQQAVDTLRNTLFLRDVVRSFKPDVLHSFSRLLYLLPELPTDLPKLMTYERKPSARAVAQASALGGGSLLFVGCSDHIADQGRRAGGRWRTVHNAVDLSHYQLSEEVAADAPLVFLSRVERLKGPHTAIAIARQAKRRLIIAGNHGESGPDKHYWDEEIAPWIGKDGIEYIGPVNDQQKNTLLGQAAALLVPIEWDEPFGIVFIEALACGTPVISSARGAVPEIIRPGQDGFLVSSVEDGCKAVAELPHIDRHQCRRHAEAFSAGKMAAAYEALYQEMHRETRPQLVQGVSPVLRRLQTIDFPRKLGICERLFGRKLAARRTTWVPTAAGITWKLDLTNPTHRWIVYGKYEGSGFLNWARHHLPANGLVVDSGANIGQVLLYLAQWVPHGKVLAFEPGREAADWLAECLSRHRDLPVELIRAGLGAAPAERRLVPTGPGEVHGAWNQIGETGGEPVSLLTLDSVVAERGLHAIDLWKLDVEGYEVPALEGAQGLLKEKRIKALLVELSEKHGATVRTWLESRGYRAHRVDPDGSIHTLPTSVGHENALFLPEAA